MLGISDGNNFAFADVPREVNPGDAGACPHRVDFIAVEQLTSSPP